MKKVVIGVLVIAILFFGVRILRNKSKKTTVQVNNKNIRISPSHYPPTTNHSRSIFVPYWAGEISENDSSKYDTYYYFGVSSTRDGTIDNDLGLQNITIVKNIPQKQKKLVLRMLDMTITEALLDDNEAQKKLILQLKGILNKTLFSGVVLDMEIPFTLNTDKKEQITKYVQLMCTAIQSDYKTCDMLIYGDFQYRNRPYDLKNLGKTTDKILLMAYDFHKSGGEPGPNFPLSRRGLMSEGGPSTSDYGYDFKQMVSDTVALVPKQKIEVVFGMYGYDWTLNEQGTPLKAAKALSVSAIQSIVESRKLIIESNEAKEKTIHYIDEEGRRHIIWSEDEESAAIKIKYLQGQGISQVSFWALSYF